MVAPAQRPPAPPAAAASIDTARRIRVTRGAHPALPWDPARTRAFGSGREAMVALVRALEAAKAPEAAGTARAVLLPAYVPEGMVAPFDRCGWARHLYRIDPDCEPDWEDVEAGLAAHRPTLAVLIHTFGVPRDVARFRALCHRHGTRLIEDAAHLLPRPDPVLGSTGDVVLWSLPKVLGVPDGAPLWLRDPTLDPDALATPSHRLRRRYLALQVADLGLTSLAGTPLAPLARRGRRAFRRLFDPYETLMRSFEGPSRMSRLSAALLARSDLEEIARRRRALAEIYEDGLDRDAFVRFPRDHLPWSSGFGFPIRVGDRDGLHAALVRRGARGMTLERRWRFVPDGERERHAAALAVLARHYVLPTPPHLREDDVRRVVAWANAWARERRGGDA